MAGNRFEIVMGLEPYVGDGQIIEAEATQVIAVTPKLPEYSVGMLLKRLSGALGGVEVDEREVSHEFIITQGDEEKPKYDPDRALRFTRKLIRQSVRPEELEDVIILTTQPIILQNADDEVFDAFYEYEDADSDKADDELQADIAA